MLLRVGSRGSRLALTQAELAAERLRRPGVEIALLPITTAGDRDRTKPFGEIGSRGVFVKELEEALLAGRIDVAVHSAKDVPAELPDDLELVAFPPRVDPRDALCGASSLADLKPGSRVGTSSLRRSAQLRALREDLEIVSLRGNVDTRLRKLAKGDLDAIVIAAAGLHRLGRESEVGAMLDELVPAPGQGALAIEARRGDGAAGRLAAVTDSTTAVCVQAERELVRLLLESEPR